MRQQRDVSEALAGLAGALEALEFGPDTAVLSADRDRVAGIIRTYLIPRTIDPSAPMTVVLAGPTGSGKSTLLNSLSGADVSRTGPIRPTTQRPVVVAPPESAGRYQTIGDVSCDVVSVGAGILESLVLVDAPDLDSTYTDHRVMAESLIDNADVVVFVTSALRYADDVPWQVLRRAVSRGTPVIQVLNRVGSSSAGAIVDFKSRLAAAGLDDGLVTVSEHHLADEAQRVPTLAIRSLHDRLADVVANRDEFTTRVLDRVLHSTVSQVSDLARAISDIDHEIDLLEIELLSRMTDRRSRLDFTGIGRDLYLSPPGRATRWALRRWRKRASQVDEGSIAGAESKVVDRMVAVVHADIRRWFVEEHDTFRGVRVDSTDVVARATSSARSTVDGWVSFVSRIAASHDERDTWLNEAVLLDAATARGPVAVVAVTLGEGGHVLVERARRELAGRLDAVYRQTGELVVEAVRRRHGLLDDSELRTSLGALTSALAPVHA